VACVRFWPDKPNPATWSITVPPPPLSQATALLTTSLTPAQVFNSRTCALSTVPHIHNLSDASFVACHHRAFGSPALSTFLRAMRKGRFPSLPRLAAKLVLQNPPLSPHTAFGHLDLMRQNLHSSRKPDPPASTLHAAVSPLLPGTADGLTHPSEPSRHPSPRASAVGKQLPSPSSPNPTPAAGLPCGDSYRGLGVESAARPSTTPSTLFAATDASSACTVVVDRHDWAAADLTGKFPIKSRRGSTDSSTWPCPCRTYEV
jgi:hypothetical protein